MSPDDRLARWYRRLMLAYPRRYRRTRGPEIVSTLLDAAEPGQRRPRWRDAANLVLRGLMRRFEIPRGPGYAVAAATFAFFCAFGVSAGVAWAAWQRPERVPSTEVALAVARLATATGPHDVQGPRQSIWPAMIGFDDPDRPPPGYPAEPTSVQIAAPAGESGPTGAVALARGRLAGGGWRVGDVRTTAHSVHLVWATHGDTVVQVSSLDADTAMVYINVFHRTPSWIGLLVAAGGAVGLAGGWLVAGAGLRAFRRFGLRGRVAMTLLGAPGLLAAVAATIYAVLALVVESASGAGPAVVWRLLVVAARDNDSIIGMAVLALGGAAVVATFAPRAPNAVSRFGPAGAWRIGAGAAATAHLAFAVTSCAVVVVYLVMVWKTGQRPVTGAHDPKDLVPFGSSPLNPFMWAFDMTVLLYITGGLLSPLLLALSVPLLVSGRLLRLASVGRVRLLLLVAAVSSVVPLLLLVTPLGHEVGTWLMD